jgi:hypothetical protein
MKGGGGGEGAAGDMTEIGRLLRVSAGSRC